MDDLGRGAGSPQKATHVHEAGHICAGDELRAVAQVIMNAVTPHGDRDIGFEDGEGAAKTTAFIGTIQVDQLDILHGGEEAQGLGKILDHAFGWARQAQAAQAVAALMQTNPMRKSSAQFVQWGDIVEKLGQLIDAMRQGIVPGFELLFQMKQATR